MKKLAIIVLVTAALGFSVAPPAHAWSDFIIHLASSACQGRNSNFKNGCYAYIEPRINKASSPSEALKWCQETRCTPWFTGQSDRKKQCYEGCDYLYKMGK